MTAPILLGLADKFYPLLHLMQFLKSPSADDEENYRPVPQPSLLFPIWFFLINNRLAPLPSTKQSQLLETAAVIFGAMAPLPYFLY